MRKSNFTYAATGVAVATIALLAWIHFGFGGPKATEAIDDWGEFAAAAVGGGLCLFAARRGAPTRAGWILVGVSALSWAAGEAIWSYYETIAGRQVPFPSLADAGYLLAVPLEVGGVLLLARSFRNTSRAVTLLDGFIIAGALLYISWSTVLHAVYSAGADSPLAMVLSLAYPVGDVITGVLVLTVLAHSRRFDRPLVLIGAGLACLALSDSTFAYLTALGTYKTNVVDAGWFVGYLLIGLGGFAAAGDRTEMAREAAPRLRAVLPYIPLIAVAVLFAGQLAHEVELDRLSLWTLLSLGVMVVVRQLGAVLDLQGLSGDLATLVQKLRDREAELEHRAFHDVLTNLANRQLFGNRVEHALARSRRSGAMIALLFLDIDDFKNVNDSLGHAAGDLLLQSTAERLRACVRPGDTTARLSGDEFAVLLEDLDDPEESVRVADRILEAFRTPFQVGRDVYVSPSVGIVCSQGDGAEVAALIRDADTAMYAAKSRGKSRYAIFEDDLRTDVAKRLELRSSLAAALDRGELAVHYQPVHDLRDMRLLGVEALARWRRDGAWVPPAEFIQIAEESGLIADLGRFVLRRSCSDLAQWVARDAGLQRLFLSVNVSASQLAHPDFVADVRDVLATTGLRPERLILELTENVLMLDTGIVAERLVELSALGIRLAIDDFGKGYSSLNYLVKFPINIVKIDRAFVAELPNRSNRAVIRSIASLCHSLNIVTVAEGIETEEQLAELRRLSCDTGQGFWLNRPVPAAEVEKLLRGGAPAQPAGVTSTASGMRPAPAPR